MRFIRYFLFNFFLNTESSFDILYILYLKKWGNILKGKLGRVINAKLAFIKLQIDIRFLVSNSSERWENLFFL